MGMMKDLAKPIQKAEAKFREEQHVANLKQMEELAKIRPTPTNDDIQAAASGKVTEEIAIEEVAVEKTLPSKKEEKVSNPDTSSKDGSYKTRDTKAGK